MLRSLVGSEMCIRDRLGIASFGASVTTLEEVFIKVGDEHKANEEENKTHKDLFRQLSTKKGNTEGLFALADLGLIIPKLSCSFFSILQTEDSIPFSVGIPPVSVQITVESL